MEPEMNENEEHLIFRKDTDDRSFGIAKCSICKRTPSLNRHDNKNDSNRYSIQCCSGKVHAFTQTACIVEWNKLQDSLIFSKEG